eukprot:CAMPEP_0170285942 /NCGR_PEP_ID=MMETSP0116_2-20130129/43025_1 /TAXON_ID=400756 /ORGANISM="Durinskia baltica, Strain CSIRO CS-38" /LENGTH=58 /DNA_ID=CAMNT_0010537353 /DNA_START=167 /DNA_END=340 /DNA_ORIENTATION=+
MNSRAPRRDAPSHDRTARGLLPPHVAGAAADGSLYKRPAREPLMISVWALEGHARCCP